MLLLLPCRFLWILKIFICHLYGGTKRAERHSEKGGTTFREGRNDIQTATCFFHSQ